MGLAGAFALMQAQTALTASFSAREAAKEIYRQGFDTREGMTDWSVPPSPPAKPPRKSTGKASTRGKA